MRGQMKHKPSKWDILHQTQPVSVVSRGREPKQHDALFECPRNTKNEEEGEKRVLVAFGPEIRWFWKYCYQLYHRIVQGS